jgi:putative transposase
MREAARRAKELDKNLMVKLQDESRHGRINRPRACWCPPGMRPSVGCQIVREYTYLYGAVNPMDGTGDFLVLPNMKADCFLLFAEEISRRYPDNFVLLVCDGAASHLSKKMKRLPQNIGVVHIPPYSPELNPVEIVWREIRRNFFPNGAMESMEEVERRLVEAVEYYELNPGELESICGQDWICNIIKEF